MTRKIRISFFLKIVLPALLALLFFVLSVFLVIIPAFERSALDQKRVMLSELTNTTWSILSKYHSDEIKGIITTEEAQFKAKTEIEALRYGNRKKDYFWITDTVPFMVMHPYVHELTGKDLHEYADPDGVKLFIEAAKIAESSGEGFINYKWQMNDDSTLIVPKMSFVKKFDPWNWIIGTGIYLDDVQDEIGKLTKKLLLLLLIIAITVSLFISYIALQSYRIDKKRREAESKLLESREKYRSLIESTKEGVILLLNSKISYTNTFIQNWLSYSTEELMESDLKDLFLSGDIPELESLSKEASFDVKLKRKDGKECEALLTAIPVRFADKEGVLLTFRDTSEYQSVRNELKEVKSLLENHPLQEELSKFTVELSNRVILNCQPVNLFSSPVVSCKANHSVKEAIEIMMLNNSEYILPAVNGNYIGILTTGDIVGALSDELSSGQPVTKIMRSPLYHIGENCSIEEAVVLMERKGVSHLLVINNQSEITGVLEKKNLFGIFSDRFEYVNESIEKSKSVKDLSRIRKRIPFIVKPLINEYGSSQFINKIITGYNDLICRKIISDAIKELGEPPVPFTFISLGSDGREELVFNSDQDNAIVYADDLSSSKEETDQYFAALSKKVCNNLHESGIELCSGDYMASNPVWCRPVSTWKSYFEDWIVNAEPENILNISVFFDLRFIYGDNDLFRLLEDYIFETLKGRSAFFYFLAQSVSGFKPQVNIFGNIVSDPTKKSSELIEIKRALSAVIMFTRIFALHNGIRSKGTLERASSLLSAGILSKETAQEVKYHFNFLMLLRIRHQADQILRGEIPDNNISSKNLSEMEKFIMKRVFSQISNYDEILTATFMSSYKGG
ncbi:MAG: DUF294 nucleotidyltransferase-like domain-containing protein [Bacteroidales bacterium]